MKYNIASIAEHPELNRLGIFSLAQAEQILDCPRKRLNPFLFRLVKKGRLLRIKRGLFCLLPRGVHAAGNGYPYNWYLIAKALAGNRPYFISHYSAMRLHGMTGEAIQTIFVSTAGQLLPPRNLKIPIRFVALPGNRFWGTEEKWVTHEEKVRVSGLARTAVDALDRLDLCGGIGEVSRGLGLIQSQIEASEFIDAAKRLGSRAAAKRLGFLMEILNLGAAEEREKLRRFALSSQSYVLFDSTLPPGGPRLPSWRLILNRDPKEIENNLMT